jgi:signal transduction histidine kinase
MLLSFLLLSLFLLVLLGFYVFIAAPKNRAHQTFVAFTTCMSLWIIKDIILWGFYSDIGTVGWWASISFILSLLLQFSLVIFALTFPENKPLPISKISILFAPGAVMIPAIMAGWMWEEVSLIEGRFNIKLTLLAYAFGIYAYTLHGYGFWLLYKKYSYYRGKLWGQQLGAILWALIVTGIIGTLINIILPLSGVYSLLPFSSVFLSIGVIIYAYAITNFKLFSLQSALDQFRLFPVAYKVALSIAIVAILSFTLIQIPIVLWSFKVSIFSEAWRKYLVFSLITALVPNLILVALIVRTISRPVRQLTEAAVAVAGGAYGTRVDLNSNDEVGLLAASFNEMSMKMASDIEELRKLNEHLIKTEKLAAAGTLAAGVAHEVNNPLAAISSLVQMLQTRPTIDDESKEMLRLISSQITRISQVLRGMLDFAHTKPTTRIHLDIKETLDASIKLAMFDKLFRKINLITQYEDGLPKVYADANQLQQVFLNILFNARDAMPNGGEIIIRIYTDRASKEISIEISDTGSGIAPEHLSQVFSPFFTTKAAGSGTGLGLSVCYGIITSHGGRCEIESKQGEGTLVRVILPVESSNL